MSQTLLDQITEAVADEYRVLGQLGETPRGSAFLARERAGGHLVVLAVPPSADELSVLGAVSEEVPANAGVCTACGQAPPMWTAFCQTCGRAFVEAPVDAHRYTADEVRGATEHAYDVQGEVAHQNGGSLFFMRDRVDGRLVALSGQRDADGEQALTAVWEAIRAGGYAVAPPAERPADDAYGTFDAPFDAPSYGTGASGDLRGGAPPAVWGDTGVTETDAPPGYPPGYVDPHPPVADDGAMPRRRRWVPYAVAGAVVLGAGAVWAGSRGRAEAAPETGGVDSTRVVATANTASVPPVGAGAAVAGAAGAGTGGSADVPTVSPNGSVGPNRGATPPGGSAPTTTQSVPPVGTVPPAEDPRATSSQPAQVQLEGAGLPAGWTWTVNGRRGPASLTARLRPGRPAALTIEAPGYCPETLQVDDPAAGSVQRWAPRLRGKPMVGEC